MAMTLRQGIQTEFSSGKLVISMWKWEDGANVNFTGKAVKKAVRYD